MSRLKLTDAQRRLVDRYRESFDYVEDRDPECLSEEFLNHMNHM